MNKPLFDAARAMLGFITHNLPAAAWQNEPWLQPAREAIATAASHQEAWKEPGTVHCFDELLYKLHLEQDGKGAFTVVYGAQRVKCQSYSEAAAEYGSCLMHALVCEGRIKVKEDRR